MTTSEEFVIPGAAAQPLAITVDTSPEASGWVVFCHGFKGFRRWGGWPWMSQVLADRGMTVIRFDFSHCGTAPGTPEDFSRLDLFERNTWSRELFDLAAVLAAARSGGLGVDPDRLGELTLVGHSKGGGVVLLAAQRSLAARGVGLASVGRTGRMTGVIEAIRANGFAEVVNGRTGQVMRIGPDYLLDLEENREALDIPAAVAADGPPVLLLHGSQDEAVPVSEVEALTFSDRVRLEVIEGAGHTFGTRHPFAGPSPEFCAVVERVAGFCSSGE